MCGIKDYRYYTISLSNYHGCCQYHESMSISRVHVNTISPCLYHGSMSIEWVLVNFMHACLYHESFPVIPWVKKVNLQKERKNYGKTIFRNTEKKWQEYRNRLYRTTKIQATEIQKYRNKNYRKTEIQITKGKNTNCKYKKIQITELKKYKLQEYRNASEQELLTAPRGTLRCMR